MSKNDETTSKKSYSSKASQQYQKIAQNFLQILI
jgi:hypothetical protein